MNQVTNGGKGARLEGCAYDNKRILAVTCMNLCDVVVYTREMLDHKEVRNGCHGHVNAHS